MGTRLLVGTLVAASIAMTGCGASLRRSHRASAYFEECYAADLDRAVPDADRRACWQAWSRSYLVGASPERLDYVHERLAMLDPDRAAAIALATGDDGSIEQLDTPDSGDTANELAASEPTTNEIGGTGQDTTDVGADVTPAIAAVPIPVAEPVVAPQPTPVGSEVAPADMSAARASTDARHQRTHERHLHRGIVTPASDTPRCPCAASWQACSALCLADDYGCIGACRSDFRLCSRSCY